MTGCPHDGCPGSRPPGGVAGGRVRKQALRGRPAGPPPGQQGAHPARVGAGARLDGRDEPFVPVAVRDTDGQGQFDPGDVQRRLVQPRVDVSASSTAAAGNSSVSAYTLHASSASAGAEPVQTRPVKRVEAASAARSCGGVRYVACGASRPSCRARTRGVRAGSATGAPARATAAVRRTCRRAPASRRRPARTSRAAAGVRWSAPRLRSTRTQKPPGPGRFAVRGKIPVDPHRFSMIPTDFRATILGHHMSPRRRKNAP